MKTILKLKKTKNIELILQVKGNQRKLLAKCVDITKTKKAFSRNTQSGKKERNRIEKRIVNIFHKDDYDFGDVWNDGVSVIIKIERSVDNLTQKQNYLQKAKKLHFTFQPQTSFLRENLRKQPDLTGKLKTQIIMLEMFLCEKIFQEFVRIQKMSLHLEVLL